MQNLWWIDAVHDFPGSVMQLARELSRESLHCLSPALETQSNSDLISPWLNCLCQDDRRLRNRALLEQKNILDSASSELGCALIRRFAPPAMHSLCRTIGKPLKIPCCDANEVSPAGICRLRQNRTRTAAQNSLIRLSFIFERKRRQDH